MQTGADRTATPALALARELRLMRDLSGKSLKELERLTYVSDSSLSRYLSGRLVAPWAVVVALCKLVRREPAELRPLWDRASEPPARVEGPNLLPRDVPDFTGRDETVQLLLDDPAGGIDAIDGMAGVGKTTLAVHVAHRLADRYPDGQLFLNLHGHTPGHEPLSPADALRALLTAAGVPPGETPEDDRAAAARWRAALTGRRVLLVLDNAATAAQVTPLLPDSPGCRTIVTSRQRLIDLYDARPVPLDVLPPIEAAALFDSALGASGDDHDEVVRLCGYLPLGIRLAAARLRHRPTWTVEHLAQLLRDEQRRLPTLAAGEQGVATAFGLSYKRLEAGHRRMFRLLGLVPGGDIDRFAAASLAGLPAEAAEELLEDLVDAHLVQQPQPDRYRLHDLLRQYARKTVETTDSAAERGAATLRLLDFYLHVTVAAGRHLSTQIWPISLEDVPPWPLPPISDTAEALGWLDREAANLSAAIRYAGAAGYDRHAATLSQLLLGYQQARGWSSEHPELVRIGLAAAERLGDRVALARLHRSDGVLKALAGDRNGGRASLERALQWARAAADRQVEVVALHNIGFIDFARGEYAAALPVYEQAAALRREYGGAGGNAMPIAVLGYILAMLGRVEEADACSREALAISQATADGYPLTMCHHTLGVLALRAGRLDEADDHFSQMLSLASATGHRGFEAYAHHLLATVQLQRGEPTTHLDLAEAIAADAEIVDTSILNLRGRVHLAAGLTAAAIDCFQASLDGWTAIGNRHNEAYARLGLADALAADDPDAAKLQRARARELLASLGIPDPDR